MPGVQSDSLMSRCESRDKQNNAGQSSARYHAILARFAGPHENQSAPSLYLFFFLTWEKLASTRRFKYSTRLVD